jgi:anti-anti-sigma factor
VGASTVIELDGDADLGSAPQLTQLLHRVIGDLEPDTTMIVDLDGLTVLDDVALGLLLGAAASARRRSIRLAVVCTNERLRERLTETRVDRIVDILTTTIS